MRGIYILIGSVITLLGLFLVPVPGPGWATVFLGLGVIAGEFLSVAKALDTVELKGRAVLKSAERWWERVSLLPRLIALLLLGFTSFLAGYCCALFLIVPGTIACL